MIHNHTFGQKVILMRQMNSFLERFSHSFPLAKQIQEFAQNSKNAKNAKIIVLDYSEVTVSLRSAKIPRTNNIFKIFVENSEEISKTSEAEALN